MNGNTPWYKSKGVLGGLSAIASGLFAAYMAYITHDMNGVLAGMTAAFGGTMAVVGRVQATTVIASTPPVK